MEQLRQQVGREVVFCFGKNGVEHFSRVSLRGAKQSRLHVRIVVIHRNARQRLTRERVVPFTQGQGQLVSHANAGIIDELQQRGGEVAVRAFGRRRAQKRFGQTQGELFYGR